MRIGIDIDNTLCSTNKVSSGIYKKIYNDDFNKLDKISQYEFIGENGDIIFDSCPIEEKAKKIIDKLREEGNEIYIITARSDKRVKNIEERTIKYLYNNGINYDKIIFGQDEKYDIYEQFKLDIMLDDDYDVYEKISNMGGNCVLYNGSLNYGKNGDKVYYWDEFYNFIRKETNNG